MTTVFEMAKLETHSKEWFAAAFEGVNVPDYIRVVAAKIAKTYGIDGQADPGYIANLINRFVTDKPTTCPATSTGEHMDGTGFCTWCWQFVGRQ